MTLAAGVFWSCLAVCVYEYFGYPGLLLVLSRVRPRPVREGAVHPTVSFIIPAYNEERHIAEKIRNSLSLDYPGEKLEVIVAANGSTDRTVEIASSWSDPRVRLVVLPAPGKIAALNAAVRDARGEILVFSDADFLLDRETLARMAARFADPEVGGVCGARGPAAGGEGAAGEGENLYHRFDRWQKTLESRIGSVFAADGLLYAIRRDLYVPVKDEVQADDIAISARVPLQGFRLLFDPQATAWEQTQTSPAGEFARKIRVTNHSVRALMGLGTGLFTAGFYSLELVSHKLLRHLVPFFMIPLLVSNAILAGSSSFYRALLAPHLLFYALAAAGALFRNSKAGRNKVFYVPWYLCFVNAAALLGVLSIVRGKKLAAWSRGADRVVTR